MGHRVPARRHRSGVPSPIPGRGARCSSLPGQLGAAGGSWGQLGGSWGAAGGQLGGSGTGSCTDPDSCTLPCECWRGQNRGEGRVQFPASELISSVGLEAAQRTSIRVVA